MAPSAFILILLCAALDRLRGDNKDILNVGALDKAAYSLVIALMTGGFPNEAVFLAFIVLYSTGMSFGWGTPLGACIRGHGEMSQDKLEWWQVGILKTNVTAAVWARGVLWGLPILPLAIWNPYVWSAFFAIVIAFPVAPLLAQKFNKDNQWEWMEVYRGALNGTLALTFSSMMM